MLRGHERDRRGARVGPVGGILVADGRNGDSMLSSVTDGIGPQERRPGVMLIDAKEQLPWKRRGSRAPWATSRLADRRWREPRFAGVGGEVARRAFALLERGGRILGFGLAGGTWADIPADAARERGVTVMRQ